jgi:hypothetical protein
MIRYELTDELGTTTVIEINEDLPTVLELLEGEFKAGLLGPNSSHPKWAKLDFHKCEDCPLGSQSYPYCPAAVALQSVVPDFSSIKSTSQLKVKVICEGKVTEKSVDAQTALRMVFGLKMSLSGCPVLGKFKMLGKRHLPFATLEETILRTIAMFVVNKINKKDKDMIVFRLSEIEDFYSEISRVNKDFFERISEVVKEDSSLNALVILNSFSEFATIGIRDMIKDFS